MLFSLASIVKFSTMATPPLLILFDSGALTVMLSLPLVSLIMVLTLSLVIVLPQSVKLSVFDMKNGGLITRMSPTKMAMQMLTDRQVILCFRNNLRERKIERIRSVLTH